MKIFLLALLISLSTSIVQAQKIVLDIPEGVGYVEITANFDGSVTLKHPMVEVNGNRMLIHANSAPWNDRDLDSAKGVCALLKKTLVSQNVSEITTFSYAKLSADGSLKSFNSSEEFKSGQHFAAITCK